MAYNNNDFEFHMEQVDEIHLGIRPYLEKVVYKAYGKKGERAAGTLSNGINIIGI